MKRTFSKKSIVISFVAGIIIATSVIVALSVNQTDGPVPIPLQIPFQTVFTDAADGPVNTTNGLCVVFEVYSDEVLSNLIYKEADSLSTSDCSGSSSINDNGELEYDDTTMVLTTLIGDNATGGCGSEPTTNTICPEDFTAGSLWVNVSASTAADGSGQEAIGTFQISPTAYAIQAEAANNADYATDADNAINADYATDADHATNADSAVDSALIPG